MPTSAPAAIEAWRTAVATGSGLGPRRPTIPRIWKVPDEVRGCLEPMRHNRSPRKRECNVINIRGSYDQEAWIEHLTTDLGVSRIAIL
jgi:hypothetical protein